MRHIIVMGLIASACSQTPEEAIRSSTASVSDGFSARSGVAIASNFAVSDLELIETSQSTDIRIGSEPAQNGRILARKESMNLALINLGTSTKAPTIGDSGGLAPGAPIHAGVFAADGITMKSGTVTGIRNHKGRWYIETDLALPESARAAGVVNESGELVGLFDFQLTEKLNYVLPVEYVISELGSLSDITGAKPSEAFAGRAKTAAESKSVLETPPTYESLEAKYNFAHRDLVGKISHLRKKDEPFDPAVVRWTLHAKNPDGAEEVASGTLSETTSQWHIDEDAEKARRARLAESLGESIAKERLDPYRSGELRFRIPSNAYCKSVREGLAYELVVNVGDDRKTEPFTYSDLINICAGFEAGDGAEWVQSWGMVAAKEPAPKGAKKRKRRRKKRR